MPRRTEFPDVESMISSVQAAPKLNSSVSYRSENTFVCLRLRIKREHLVKKKIFQYLFVV